MQTNNIPRRPVDSLIDERRTEIREHASRNGPMSCDLEEMSAHREAVKARVRSHAVLPFNPDTIASDRELDSLLKSTKERLFRLRDTRDVMQTRLTNAREQTERMPAPRKSIAAILTTGTGLFTLCFAPTIFSAFFASLDDAVLAWLVSVMIGAAVGGFLCLLLLNFEEECQ